MTATSPAWAASQPAQALAKANRVRLSRAAYRKDLRAMSSYGAAAELADVFRVYGLGLECDALEECDGDEVLKLIRSIRRITKQRIGQLAVSAPRLLTHDRLRIGGSNRLDRLTAREALALADGLRLLYPAPMSSNGGN